MRSRAVFALRTAIRKVAGAQPGAESSVAKLVGVAHTQEIWETAMDWKGQDALHDGGERGTPTWWFLSSRNLSIAGGTTDVQLNIIGERILGLPGIRSRRRPPRAARGGPDMPIDAVKALAAAPTTRVISWSRRDVLLYHLTLGAGRQADITPSSGGPSSATSRCCPPSRWWPDRDSPLATARPVASTCRASTWTCAGFCTLASCSQCTGRFRPRERPV